jgi:hypothetical protein
MGACVICIATSICSIS